MGIYLRLCRLIDLWTTNHASGFFSWLFLLGTSAALSPFASPRRTCFLAASFLAALLLLALLLRWSLTV